MEAAFTPNLPLNCINPRQPEQLGQPCKGCPLIERSIGCAVMDQGAQIAEVLEEKDQAITNLETAKTEIEETNALLVQRLFNLRIDSLVQEAFTPEGLKDVISNEEGIIAELKEMNWGVIRLDGRFVKYLNNKFGNLIGDSFLEHGGSEVAAIADGLIRTKNRRVQVLEVDDDQRVSASDRRAGYSMEGDIICRQGGDEFSLIIRQVDAVQLERIAARIQGQLDVNKALDSYEHGKVPFIASVGSCHASKISPAARAALEENDDLWTAFRDINGQADKGQRDVKTQQYEVMWGRTVRAMAPHQSEQYISQPSDDSRVAELFLEVLCPEFKLRPHRYLAGRGTPVQSSE